jgi:two-component system nitrate/nitrite response regulator NarL
VNLDNRDTQTDGPPAPVPPAGPGVPKAAGPARQGGPGNAARRTRRRLRLVIVDDHPLVRKGIGSCLDRRPEFEVVAEAGDGKAAVDIAKALAPDIVLMDLELPLMDGLAVTELLRRENPDIKVLILSMHSSPEQVLRILKAGARGYVLKGAPPEVLVQAIETVQAGHTFFSPEVAQVAMDRFADGAGQKPAGEVTTREREVLIQIADGLSNKEIAIRLNLGVRTVESHRERIMRKLGIHSVAGLTKYAIGRGWVAVR